MTSTRTTPSQALQGLGSDLVAMTLARSGVSVVFGLPGTQNVDLLESLARNGIRFMSATNECAAGFMALGYARAHDTVGVLTTIPGPGFTYALSAVAEAREDSIPLLYILVGPEFPERSGALHAIAHRAIGENLVKSYVAVPEPAEISEAISSGLSATQLGEPGPVIVEISYQALRAYCSPGDKRREHPAESAPAVNQQQLSELLAKLQQARRPMLFVGQGAARAHEELRTFVHSWSVPVLSTCSGRGVISDDDPFYIPVDFALGVSEAVQELIRNSDLVLALGCKLSHNGTGGFALPLEETNLVQVNSSFSGTHEPSKYGWSCEDFLRSVLAANIATSSWKTEEIAALRERFLVDRSKPIPYPPTLLGIEEDVAEFFALLRKCAGENAIFVTDAGLHQSLTRRYLPVTAPRTLLCPTDFQAMGFGIPAAIGCAMGDNDESSRRIVALVGDGACLCSGMELSVAARENLPLVVIVWNDGHYGSIYREQVRRHGNSRATELTPFNFERFARATGVRYERIEGELEPSLNRVFWHKQPVLAELSVEEHPGLAVAAATSRMRATVRRTLGRRLTSSLRNLVKK